MLSLEGRYAAFREGSPDHPADIAYALAAGNEIALLDDVQWADWSSDGHLLVATRAGTLQIRSVTGLDSTSIVFEKDLSALEPDPQPPPEEAARWD